MEATEEKTKRDRNRCHFKECSNYTPGSQRMCSRCSHRKHYYGDPFVILRTDDVFEQPRVDYVLSTGVEGEWLTRKEQVHIVDVLTQKGTAARAIGRIVGLCPRTVARMRKEIRDSRTARSG